MKVKIIVMVLSAIFELGMISLSWYMYGFNCSLSLFGVLFAKNIFSRLERNL